MTAMTPEQRAARNEQRRQKSLAAAEQYGRDLAFATPPLTSEIADRCRVLLYGFHRHTA